MSILLFRPRHKLGQSQQKFSRQGIPVVPVALIENRESQEGLSTLAKLISHQAWDCIVVTSTFAAELFLLVYAACPKKTSATVCAVGSSTAKILQSRFSNVEVASPPDSDGLLALPALQQPLNKRILLVKGEGGRDVIRQTLSRLGAEVTISDVYQRYTLDTPTSTEDWHPQQIRCIIVTSGEQLQLAFQFYDNDWLRSLPWIVVSQRIAQMAATLGISDIKVSEGADDTSLITAVRDFLE